ncbi:MAG: FKBP-type peptidyl-prolyl cis-trans isomerase [Bacteroidia bacterium]
MSDITINPNAVVGVSYQLKLSNGELADEATSEQPLLFIHGIGQTLPDFDSNLSGLSIGDNFEFTLTAEQGYGEHNPNYVVDLEKQIFEGPDVPEDLLTVGNMLPMQDQEGNPLDGKVLEVGDATVKMDFNHPLAGESLNFTGTVLSIREATPEELSHGHVHGEGGVQH